MNHPFRKTAPYFSLCALAAVSTSQADVVFSDGFETGGTTLVDRNPDTVNFGTAVWISDGGGSTATIVDEGGNSVIELVNNGTDAFAVETSETLLFGQMKFDARFTAAATDPTKNPNFRVAPGPSISLNDFRSGISLGAGGLSLNTWGEVVVVFNASDSTISYGESNEYSVAADTIDIWVNGELVTDDVSRESSNGDLDIFGFKVFDGVVGMIFQVDDLELNSSITVGSPPSPPSLTYTPVGVIESSVNPGNVTQTIEITLSNETFTADVVSGGHLYAGNVPSGLNAHFTRVSNTRVSLSFTGTADSHTTDDTISDLSVTFTDSAFTGADASAVTDSVKSDLGITFFDLPPNILMLCIDDLNDWVGFLGGHPQTKTPNMDALAAMGANFTNAHCPAPGCSPSRNAILFGAEPTTTGLYPFYRLVDLDTTDQATLDNFLPMPKFFRDNGYYTAGYTKVWHNPDNDYKQTEQWDVYQSFGDTSLNLVDDSQYYDPGNKRLRSRPANNPATDFRDRKSADAAVDILEQTHTKPFFLAVGFILPHTPFVTPVDNYDRFDFPIEAPPILAGDLSDIPLVGRANAQLYVDIPVKQDNAWEKVRRGYLASISFTDDNVGIVLDALAESPYADNTIVVLWSDHGFHLGEKQSYSKFSLWEEATRTPFIIYDPRGQAANGRTISEPVSLIDMYKTLADLAGLTPPSYVDGSSLVPWLEDPDLPKTAPAMTTWGRGNYTLRSTDWRYTRYHDGSEELYHNAADPNEWTNLAGDPAYSLLKAQFATYLPSSEAPQIESGIGLYNVSDADSPDNRLDAFNDFVADYANLGLQPPIDGFRFSDWIETAGYENADVEPDADPNQNGIPNILEYALKVPAAESALEHLPSLSFEPLAAADYATLSFRRRLDTPDLHYAVEGSNDLSDWDSLWNSNAPTDTFIHSTTYNDDGTQTIRVRYPYKSSVQPKGFLRLNVSAP